MLFRQHDEFDDHKLEELAFDGLFDVGDHDDNGNNSENKIHLPSQHSIDLNPYLDEEFIFDMEAEMHTEVVYGFTKSPRDEKHMHNNKRIAEDQLFEKKRRKKRKRRTKSRSSSQSRFKPKLKKRSRRKGKTKKPSRSSSSQQKLSFQSSSKIVTKEYYKQQRPMTVFTDIHTFKSSNKLAISDYQITPILDTSDNSEIESISNVLVKHERNIRRAGVPEPSLDDEYNFSDY